MLVIVLVVVLVVVLGAGGAWFYLAQKRAAAMAEDGEEPAAAEHHASASKTPPAYLPLDPMVINLADPGGDKVAQIGITFELLDAKAADTVKLYLPTIRNGILLLISQRTSTELLQREGKEKLAAAILAEAARPFGGGEEEEADEAPDPKKKPKRKRPRVQYPVQKVLFSSIIVQ